MLISFELVPGLYQLVTDAANSSYFQCHQWPCRP